VYAGGMRVQTTLDMDLQAAAEKALAAQLDQVASDAKHRNRYQINAERPLRPKDAPDKTGYLQGSAMAVAPRTGEILMMIGGRDYADSRFNRATQARRQPGSTFKPFIYLAALEAGRLPTDIIVDEPVSFRLSTGELWSPQNYDAGFDGPVTLRQALAKSINIPTVKLLEQVGIERVIRTARACGIRSRIPPYLSIALGSAELTLEELVFAYAVFANQGLRPEPLFVTRVVDKDGVVLEENRPRTREAIDSGPLFVLTDMLEAVMNSGTGAKARTLGLRIPVAGKSGTTNDNADAWFVGYTPDIVAGVWVGFDERKTIGARMTGSAAALPAWTEIMKAATAGQPEQAFSKPSGVVYRNICPITGLLAREGCPDPTREAFVAGEAPGEECQEHSGALFDPAAGRGARDGVDRD